jgi:hypothetical protein
MMCDWLAMGEEFGNTARSWFKRVDNVRYYFGAHQQDYIRDLFNFFEPE